MTVREAWAWVQREWRPLLVILGVLLLAALYWAAIKWWLPQPGA